MIHLHVFDKKKRSTVGLNCCRNLRCTFQQSNHELSCSWVHTVIAMKPVGFVLLVQCCMHLWIGCIVGQARVRSAATALSTRFAADHGELMGFHGQCHYIT